MTCSNQCTICTNAHHAPNAIQLTHLLMRAVHVGQGLMIMVLPVLLVEINVQPALMHPPVSAHRDLFMTAPTVSLVAINARFVSMNHRAPSVILHTHCRRAIVLVRKECMIIVLFRIVAINVQPVSINHRVHNVISLTLSLTGLAHVWDGTYDNFSSCVSCSQQCTKCSGASSCQNVCLHT